MSKMDMNHTLFSQFKKLSKHSVYYIFGNVSARFLSLFLLPLYTRFLDPQEYGIIYAMLITSFFLGIIIDLRQNTAVLRIYYDHKDDSTQLKNYLGSVFIFAIISSSLMIGLLLLRGKVLFSWLFEDIPFYPYIFLTLIYAFFRNSLTFPTMLFRVREEALKYSIFNISRFLLSHGLIIYFVIFLKEGALGYIKGSLFTSVIFFIIYLFLALREITFRFSLTLLKPGLKYGIPLIPLAVSTWVIQGSDRFFLAQYSTLASVGLYSIAYSLAHGIGMLGFSVSQAWQPMFYSAAGDRQEVNRLFPSLSTYLLLFMLLLVLGVSLFSKEILFLMTDKKYHMAYYIIPIIASIFLFDSIYNISCCGIGFLKKTYIVSFNNILAALINIFLNFVLVPKYGMVGAAFATLAAYIFRAFSVLGISQRLYKINYEYKRCFIMLFLGGAFMSAGVYINRYEIDVENIFIKLFLMLGFFASLYFFNFFKPEEIEKFKSLVRSKIVSARGRVVNEG